MMEMIGTKILTQCCGLTILITILIFNTMRKRLQLRSAKNYIGLVTMTAVCTVFDILSVFFILLWDNRTGTALDVVTRIVCKAYISTLVLVTGFGTRYLCADMYKKEKTYLKSRNVVTIAVLVECVIVMLTPIDIVLDEKNLYTEGIAPILTYAFVVLNVVMMIFFMEKNKKAVNSHRRKAVFLWIGSWGACALIQFFVPSLLIVSFGASIGVMIIYFALENPEANLDHETGFFNENALTRYVEQCYTNERPFSAIFCMLTNSSTISRLPIDDEILNEINTYLKDIKGAMVFKLSEVEMAIVFEEQVEADDALKLIQERFSYGWGERRNTIFFMHYIYVPNSLICESWELLSHAVRYASYTLYTGHETAVVSEEIVKQMVEENRIEEIIKDAIDNDRIEVFYQPIYSRKNGVCSSAEALARIRMSDGSIMSPGMFIPIAEKTGTIIKIGEIVFEKTCKFLSREALNERFNVDYIEINLSVVQCAYENLADTFISIMNANHINPKWINLEITESESMTAKNVLLKNMKELMLYGVTFSLDDFGTGQSNLNYVLDMPVQIVKFDREMTNSYFASENARHLMESTIKMLHEMGLKIVTEGIETKEQLDEILKLDVSFVQGYYFSKPLSSGEYLSFLENT